MNIDLNKLQPYIDKKLISVQKHPDFDLFIYNYTQKCTFSGAWDEITRMCRGLILDSQGNVIARPFDKFFNRGEQNEPHIGNFVARKELIMLWLLDKLDRLIFPLLTRLAIYLDKLKKD